jgi:predicted AlkP superfamily phosphohydrolase/phosphomutase
MLVLGLDCAAPELVFDQFRADLPTLSYLMENGVWGALESCIPCITVPAWSSMLSGCDPGTLGVYGFRNRADYSYQNMTIANGSAIHVKRVWDYLGDGGKESVVLSVPQTYPPRPIKGNLVSGFLTPGIASAFTYPAILKQEVLKIAPDYAFDVKDFRTEDKSRLHQNLLDLRDVQFKVAEQLIQRKSWDFFMQVDITLDRIHHGFWRHHDPQHRLYDPNNAYKHVIHDYYQLLDQQIRRLIELAGDDVTVLIVSDHGAKRMDGGICVNEWLQRAGWLTMKSPPREGKLTRFDEADVDWSRTRAWGAGGYYGRVFLNVEGREPQGIIPQRAYPSFRDELAEQIKSITGADGKILNTRVFYPDEIYRSVNNIAPDLMVYFGDLHWRSVGSLGHRAHYTLENDTGPDDANHAENGLFILYDPKRSDAGDIGKRQIMDIAPTILQKMGIPIPDSMQGRPISS